MNNQYGNLITFKHLFLKGTLELEYTAFIKGIW